MLMKTLPKTSPICYFLIISFFNNVSQYFLDYCQAYQFGNSNLFVPHYHSIKLQKGTFLTSTKSFYTPNHPFHNHSNSNSKSNLVLQMGMEINIRIVGRKNGSESWLNDAYTMYETRLKPSLLDVQTTWHKNDNDLIKGIDSDLKKNNVICFLDPLGSAVTSEELSTQIYDWLELGGSRLSFIIGGAEGLPSIYKSQIYAMQYDQKARFDHSNYRVLSLSSLTFTHQFARTLLMEQIYRASEIRKGKER